MKQIIKTIYLMLIIFLSYAFCDEKSSLPSQKCLNLEVGLIEACLDKANTSTDKRLNQLYNRMMKSFNVEQKLQLREQQRKWLKERSNQCDHLSNQKKITICYLDTTHIKINELIDQEIEMLPNLFEGIWQGCSTGFNKRENPELYKKYGGEPMCGGYIFYQKGKNVCGEWASWENGHDYTGRILAVLDDRETLTSKAICGDQAGARNVNCYLNPEEQKDDIKVADWEKNDNEGLKICHGQIVHGGSIEQSCNTIKKQKDATKKVMISTKNKEQTLKNNPWLVECLNYKE